MTNADAEKSSRPSPGDGGVNPNDDISQDQIGASWGKEVAKRAITGLIVFLVLVILFIWAYFREWKMSVAAHRGAAHDVIITVGVYALSGFEVTPATVTGLLTILGFSLYDTVVVFDKVRENTKDLRASRMTYAEAANLAVNQTLVRSINTSIVALIPVGAILYVGAVQLGSGALKDLALALFVGMAAGAYSSIFIATPLLAQLKSSETDVQARREAGQGPRAPRRRPLRRRSRCSRTTCRSRDPERRPTPGADDGAPTRRDATRPRARARGDGPRPHRAAGAASGRAEPACGRQQPTRQPRRSGQE